MYDIPKSMFAREVDFKIETTSNNYATCRVLALRARQINSHTREKSEIKTGETETHNPTVEALTDYSKGRIVFDIPQPE